jgi:hypothetical protein
LGSHLQQREAHVAMIIGYNSLSLKAEEISKMARFLIPKPLGLYRYGSEALDGDFDKLAFAEPVPAPLKRWPPPSGFGGGARVSSVNIPTKLRFTGRKRTLVDFDSSNHIYLVSRRFIDIVDGFQKEIQYFPVDCSWSDGEPAGQFFLFFTTVLLDAVIREKTTVTWVPTLPGEGLWQIKPGQTFTFDKSRLGNIHMWVDPNMPTAGALISEALHSALREAEIQSIHDGPIFEEV